MDLQTLQSKLKSAIQKHQITVLKMRTDPHNISIQKCLHELQAEIISLSEKQKLVVEQLRKDIEQKQCSQQSRLQRLVSHPKVINNNQVIIEFTTQNNSCKIVSSVASSPIRVPHFQPSLSPPAAVQKPKLQQLIVSPSNECVVTAVPEKPAVKHYSSSSKLEKSEFMASLGLITRKAFDEIKNRKLERKRRTTANPHFSSSALEEKKKFYSSWTAGDGSPAFKKPRGRPRLVPTLPHSPINNSVTANGHVPNGVENSAKLDQVEEENSEGTCAKCDESGNLISCESCDRLYHVRCANLQNVPSSDWSCPKCDASKLSNKVESLKSESGQWTNSLAIVHSLIALKSARTEEKDKLMKRSLELKTEKAQLEDSVKHLSDQLASRIASHKLLMKNNRQVKESVENLRKFITQFQKT